MSQHKITVSLPIPTILTLIFVVLKLTGTIAWSWWWVLSPLWIPLVIAGAIFVGLGIVASLAWIIAYFLDKK